LETGLRGKTALVTGGSSGIGKGIAQALAGEGVDLAIASRNPDPAVVGEVERHGVRCVLLHADVSQEAEVSTMVDEAIAALGHVDLYVNNAAWTWHQPVTKVTSEGWHNTLNTNLSAAMWATRTVAKHMIARRTGSMVIVGSTVRFRPAYTETAYRVSKVGLKALMEQLALELGPYGLRVNMVTPGHYQTRMTATVSEDAEARLKEAIPLHRFGDPTEVGHAAAFLLSDRLSAYTTGAEIVVDGGLAMSPLHPGTRETLEALNR